ncbi:MAG: prolipoprotein diacylglyceryl transferase [Eubacteriales bacterium]
MISFNIFGREVPIYGVCFFAGIIVAAIVGIILAKKRNFELFDLAASGAYAIIGALLGAKLMFIAVSLRMIIENNIPFEAIIKGGFVFYGGLLGGAAGLLIYIKQFHMGYDVFEIYSVVLPLGHAFGRVGCFFAGCCYGIPYDGVFSHVYHESAGMTPLEVPLLPVQLIESAGLLLLFIVQLVIFLRNKSGKKGVSCAVYLIVYPIMRFILEFFRGDRERGLYFGLSTSQWVSIMIFSVTTAFIIFKKVKKIHETKELAS